MTLAVLNLIPDELGVAVAAGIGVGVGVAGPGIGVAGTGVGVGVAAVGVGVAAVGVAVAGIAVAAAVPNGIGDNAVGVFEHALASTAIAVALESADQKLR